MSHLDGTSLDARVESALDTVARQAPIVRAEYAELVADARRHAVDSQRAGAALEAIATRRLYRLDGHPSMAAFVKGVLGISLATAKRLRQRAPARRARTRGENTEASEAARALGAWLRRHGVRATACVVRARGVPCVQIVLRPAQVKRIVLGNLPEELTLASVASAGVTPQRAHRQAPST